MVRWEKCTAPQSKNHTREIGTALPQASCVWNSEAEELCSGSHGSPRCYDKVMLFLGNHIPDIYRVLTLGRIYSSLFLAVFLVRCAKGLWMFIYGSSSEHLLPIVLFYCSPSQYKTHRIHHHMLDFLFEKQVLFNIHIYLIDKKKKGSPLHPHNSLTLITLH